MRNIESVFVGIIVFIVGIFISEIGLSGSDDAYILSMSYIRNSILYLSSIIAIIGYLILKHNKSNK